MMAASSFSYKPKGLAIGREQIRGILGGIVRDRPPFETPFFRGDIKYFSSDDLQPQYSGGTREKKILTWEEDGGRDSRHDKNARAHREHFRPADRTTIRRMH